MAGQAKIVSFDEAKTVSGSTRPSVAAPKRATGKRPSAKTASQPLTSKGSNRGTGGRSAKVSSAAGTKAKPRSDRSGSKPASKSAKSAAKTKAPARSKTASRSSQKEAKAPSRSAKNRQESVGGSKKRLSMPRASAANRGAAPRSAALSSYDGRGDDEIEEEFETKQSRIERMKRNAAKNKAGKAFTRQFGSGDSAESTSGGTRAALYKGEMGRKHKQATRMQGNPGQSMGASKKRFSGISLNPRSPKFVACLMVAACLVLSCVFLYPTAKQYYTTVREHDQLEAEYEALQQRNATIQAEVDNLTTEAGIEDRARKEFGWVKEGENAANVYGLDTYEDDSAYNKAITPGSVEAPETWYSPVLDLVFGVE